MKIENIKKSEIPEKKQTEPKGKYYDLLVCFEALKDDDALKVSFDDLHDLMSEEYRIRSVLNRACLNHFYTLSMKIHRFEKCLYITKNFVDPMTMWKQPVTEIIKTNEKSI